MTSSSGHQEHWGGVCGYTRFYQYGNLRPQRQPLLVLTSSEDARTQTVRLACQRITNQTEQVWSPIQSPERWPQVTRISFRNSQVEKFIFLNPYGAFPCWNTLFPRSFDKGEMGYEQETKGYRGKSRNIRGRMKYKSLGGSRSFTAPWRLPLQRETHMAGARRWHNGRWGSQGQDSGILPAPCFAFSLRDQDKPPVSTTASLQRPLWLHTGLSIQIGNYHPEETDQPIATGVGPPLWEFPLVNLLTEGIWNTLTGQSSSWRTDFWAGLISIASGNGPLSLPSSYRRRAPHWPCPTCAPGLTDRPHSPPWSWLRRRIELTPNTSKTHLHHESIYQQVKCWNAWVWLSTFPGNFHRNLNTPNHPQWKMDSGMAWEMSKILNRMLNKWSTWPKQDMDLDGNNFGLSPNVKLNLYMYSYIIYIYLSLEMQLYSWFLKS